MPCSALEILFVDPAVSDLETILGNLRPEVEAIVLGAATPVARQIATALAGRDGLGAVHVIAHGGPGRVSFAAGDWSTATLPRDAADLSAIGRALGEDGELRLWSCDTAAGLAGAAFVGALARTTGASYVAAADARVGAGALGGGWELAARANLGPPHPPMTAAGIQAYAGVMAVIEITVSGRIPEVPKPGSTTYFVVDRDNSAIVGNITLPNIAKPNAFRIAIKVPSTSKNVDVGIFDDDGRFVSSGFTVEAPKPNPSGAAGADG